MSGKRRKKAAAEDEVLHHQLHDPDNSDHLVDDLGESRHLSASRLHLLLHPTEEIMSPAKYFCHFLACLVIHEGIYRDLTVLMVK